MADIVVCGDLEGEIEKSGELSKLKVLGSVAIFNQLDPSRDALVRRLSDRMGTHSHSRARRRIPCSIRREQELFQSSDILSVHLRYSALSDNFVNATRLSLRNRPRCWSIFRARARR